MTFPDAELTGASAAGLRWSRPQAMTFWGAEPTGPVAG